jgi:hypothetical protein
VVPFHFTCYCINFHEVNTRERYQESVSTTPLPAACSNSIQKNASAPLEEFKNLLLTSQTLSFHVFAKYLGIQSMLLVSWFQCIRSEIIRFMQFWLQVGTRTFIFLTNPQKIFSLHESSKNIRKHTWKKLVWFTSQVWYIAHWFGLYMAFFYINRIYTQCYIHLATHPYLTTKKDYTHSNFSKFIPVTLI